MDLFPLLEQYTRVPVVLHPLQNLVFSILLVVGGGHSDTGAEISNSEFNLHLPNE